MVLSSNGPALSKL